MSTREAPPLVDTPFVNEVRLGGVQWAAVLGLVALAATLGPRAWKRIERFDPGPDYRLPYALSKDYWLYERRLGQLGDPRQVVVLGDSVVWGEYVLPDGTLSHYLNRETGGGETFINGGVDGLYPLALEGLIRYHGGPLRGRRVLLHCNLLWLSSPRADLQDPQEDNLDHPHLVPQFFPRIPSYRADASERLGAVAERDVGLLAWVDHLQIAYFGGMNVAEWTLAGDGGDPPRHPNAWRDPLAQFTREVPGAPPGDPKRGPQSRRHRPWTATGDGPTQFEWVAPERSLQWAGFQRLVRLLVERGDDVRVVVGPLNEHMLTEENRRAYRGVRDAVAAWLSGQRIAHVEPEPLPSALYADASHPLTEGYRLLAERLHQSGILGGAGWVGVGDPAGSR
jgi:hypothetical protein